MSANVSLLQVLMDSMQKWINRPALYAVRRIPVEPFVAVMLGNDDVNRAKQTTEKNEESLFDKAFSAITFLADHVGVLEPKFRVDIHIGLGNSRFFPQFPQSTLQVRFAFIHMTLGKVPAASMLHEQKRVDRLASNNQKSAGNRLFHTTSLHESDSANGQS